jgi:hypothetical protein
MATNLRMPLLLMSIIRDSLDLDRTLFFFPTMKNPVKHANVKSLLHPSGQIEN